MQKISLITSLYRSEKHLPSYLQHVKALLEEATIPLEFVLVANDTTSEEKRLLANFPQATILYCEREPLYASWNRGIEASTGEFLGFWNVDDSRTLEALVEGQRLLANQAEIVDFAYEIEEGQQLELRPANFRPPSLRPRDTVAPFFLFRRSLFERAGKFNVNFRIVGDYEWASREAVQKAAYIASEVVAGRFVLHEGNLSGGRNPLEWVEFNLALLHYGAYEFLRPVDPALMYQTWASWAKDYAPMSLALQNWFWGKDAAKRFRDYQQFRQSKWVKRFHFALAQLKLAPKDPFLPPVPTETEQS